MFLLAEILLGNLVSLYQRTYTLDVSLITRS